MSSLDMIRAWKEPAYRESLSAEEQAIVPEHPAGTLELDEDELDEIAAGTGWWTPISGMTIQISFMICIIIDA